MIAPAGAWRTVTVVATSDLKGWITNATLYPRRKGAGLAHLAPIIRDLRAEHADLILLDAGDAIRGAPNSTLASEGGSLPPLHFAILDLMNALRYDAMALGNFDLSLGWASLAHAQAQSDFRWLSANLERSGGGTVLPPYLVLERGGVRVAVLGMTTPAAAIGVDPRHLDGTAVRDLEATATRWVPFLRRSERADVVIGLFHSGLDGDYDREVALRSGTPLIAGAGRVADEGLGLDLVISGGAHRLSPRRSADGRSAYAVPVVEPGAYGNGLAVIGLQLEERDGRWAVVDVARHTLRAEATPDSRALAVAEPHLGWTVSRLAEPTRLRFTAVPRKGEFYRCAGALSHRTAAFLAARDASAALSLLPMLWRYDPPEKSEIGSPLRRAHLYRWMAFGNRMVQARLTGRQIELLLEGYVRHVRKWRVRYLEVLWPGGLRVEIAAKGSQITALHRKSDGSRLERHRSYPVWLTDFIWNGGGALAQKALLRPDQRLRQVPVTLRAAMFALLSDPSRELPAECGRWLGP